VRLFVSLDPPAEVVDPLHTLLDSFPDLPAAVRRIRPELWHLTLAFLGEVEEPAVPRLSARLAAVAQRTAPLQLELRGGGTFPSRGAPSVVWAGVVGDGEALAGLARAVSAAARRTGIEQPNRPYRPHLSVARVRGGEPADVTALVAALASYSSVPFAVRELRLVRSHLGPQPRHELLASWPLSAGEPTVQPLSAGEPTGQPSSASEPTVPPARPRSGR